MTSLASTVDGGRAHLNAGLGSDGTLRRPYPVVEVFKCAGGGPD